MKNIIIAVFILVISIGCLQKENVPQPSIHPFYPYVIMDSLIGKKDNDSTMSNYYMIYNLNTEDTAEIRRILQPYADSVVKSNFSKAFLSLTFYKKEKNFDSTYRETKQAPLFEYEKYHVATYRSTQNVIESSWEFFKDGKLMTDIEVKIEDIPDNDTLFNNNQ